MYFSVVSEVGLKPGVKIQDGNVGISLNGSAGAGVGVSGGHNGGILGKIGHALGVKGDADLGLSFGSGGVSASLGGGVSAGGGKKHDSSEEHRGHAVGWEEHHRGTANWNENSAMDWGNSDYWKEGKIIVIPISDEGGNAHWTGASGADSGGSGNADAGIIVFPHEDGSAGASGGGHSVHISGGESHDHGVIKGGAGGTAEGGGSIVLSHSDAGQWSSDKEHNTNGHGSGHVQDGGSIIISPNGQHGGHDGSKGHEGILHVNGTKDDGKRGGDDHSHVGGGGSISHGNAGGISINHGKGAGKDINVTIVEGHGGNHSGNTAGHGGVADGHEKHDEHRRNCAGIFDNEKCGSNVKETLEFIQMFIRSCDSIVHFLLEVNILIFLHVRTLEFTSA